MCLCQSIKYARPYCALPPQFAGHRLSGTTHSIRPIIKTNLGGAVVSAPKKKGFTFKGKPESASGSASATAATAAPASDAASGGAGVGRVIEEEGAPGTVENEAHLFRLCGVPYVTPANWK